MDPEVESIKNLTASRKLDFGKEDSTDSSENNATQDDHNDLGTEKGVLKEHSTIPESTIPKIGMQFDSEDSAYDFYNQYARAIGFSIRKASSHKDPSTGKVLDRSYCCSCEGKRGDDKRDANVKSHRPETRTHCGALMKVSSRHTGKYSIIKFVPEHNGHDLVSPNKSHFLRSQRKINKRQAEQIENLEKSGIPPKASLDYMARQVGGRENVGFIVEDLRNYLHSKRTMEMKEGDAGGVFNYLQRKQSEDPNFFYAVQVDKDDLITNIFWADGQMMADYTYFGDVVCFDTTYRKNKDGRPFALFVGVNHHMQTTVFGAALLYDETAETFMWLFDTFVKAMNGKKPVTILTDQDAAMAKALKEKWCETRHRLCIWHIYQNAAIHLSNVFANFANFSKDFRSCVYDYEEEEEFIEAWHNMLGKYDLQDNAWLKRLFKKKEKWALVYGRQTFCANMTSTQRSESMNSVLKKYVNYKQNLLQFLQNFGKLVDDRRYEELKADFRTSYSTQHLSFEVEILKHARKVYTHEVLKLFQQELSMGYDSDMKTISESGDISRYEITPLNRSRHHTVTFDASDGQVFCSCKKFEFAGILCSHALRVLTSKNSRQIPELYIKKRWTKKAKKGIEASLPPSTLVDDLTLNMNEENEKIRIKQRYQELCRLHSQLTTRAALTEDAFEVVRAGFIKMIEEVDVILENKTLVKPSTETTCGPTYLAKKKIVSRFPENHSSTSQTLGEQLLHEPLVKENPSDEIMVQGLKIKEKPKVKSGKRMKSGLEQNTGREKVKHNKASSNNLTATDVFENDGQKLRTLNGGSSSSTQTVSHSFPPPLPPLSQNYQAGAPNQMTHLDLGTLYRASGHAYLSPSSSQLPQNYQVGVPNETTVMQWGSPYHVSGRAFSYMPPSSSQVPQYYQVGVPSQTTHLDMRTPYRARSEAFSYVPSPFSQLSQNYQIGMSNQTSHLNLSIPHHATGHALSYAPPSQMTEGQMLEQEEFGRFMSSDSTPETKEQ